MTLWWIVLLACAGTLASKFLGYLVPPRWVAAPRPNRIADLLTVALLAALIAVQTFAVTDPATGGPGVAVDARLPAVLVAAGLFAIRVPYVVVVFAAAGVAAALRAWLVWPG
ncbi:MAG TPA: AzlD domain-containing protein [Microbacteriaceae bacterium]|nr:AzlD domain-containing protein [Microbacteriaceae bacterium]